MNMHVKVNWRYILSNRRNLVI